MQRRKDVSLVHLAHEARHRADYSHLNPRGHWGTPTAKAFVADLKETYLRAIGKHYIERYPDEARKQLALLDATENP